MAMASYLVLSLGVLLFIAASGAAAFRTGNTTAIHIGNTKSCIAGYGGREDPDTSYKFCIPSWVAFTDNGTLFGEAALNHPGTAISGFKRVLGLRMYNEVVKREMELVPYKLVQVNGRCGIQIETEGGGGKDLLAEAVAGILMSELKRMAEAHLGRKINNAVLTVPWHFVDYQRQYNTAEARSRGGFCYTRTVGEHVAAAAAYGLHEKARDGKVILVVHIGGRTTHAATFKFRGGTAMLLGGRRDAHLGGDDFTGRVVDHFVELIKEKRGRDIRRDEGALRKLRAECERAKKALSDREDTLVSVVALLDGEDFAEPLTRAKFEELNLDLLARATDLVELAVTWPAPPDQWESRKDSVDEIILVGGSARIPMVAQFFRDYFHGRREPIVEEEAAIRGAALLSRPESASFTYQCDDYFGNQKVSTDYCYYDEY